MRTLLSVAVLLCGLGVTGHAQSPEDLIAQGRGFLAQQNPLSAKQRFETAQAKATDNADANLLLAATRLLALANTPEGEALLDQLGFEAPGRNVYNWESKPPTDPDGTPIAPEEVSASRVTEFLKESLAPAFAASASNLARISDTHYTLSLTSAETSLDAVTIDYGDIQLLRALCHIGEYLCWTIHS